MHCTFLVCDATRFEKINKKVLSCNHSLMRGSLHIFNTVVIWNLLTCVQFRRTCDLGQMLSKMDKRQRPNRKTLTGLRGIGLRSTLAWGCPLPSARGTVNVLESTLKLL